MRARPAHFGETAMDGLAHQSALDPVDRIDQHPVADRPVVHPRPHCDDLSGDVQAHDCRHRHLDAGHATSGENVVVIERRCPYPQHHIAGAGLRVGEVGFKSDIGEAAMLAQHHCLHRLCPFPSVSSHR